MCASTDKLYEVSLDEQQGTAAMQQQLGSILAWTATYVGSASAGGDGRPGEGFSGGRLEMGPNSKGGRWTLAGACGSSHAPWAQAGDSDKQCWQ